MRESGRTNKGVDKERRHRIQRGDGKYKKKAKIKI